MHQTPAGTPRIVVTGLGAVTNLGLDADATWAAMRAGRSGVGTIESDAFARYKGNWAVTIAGQIKGWAPASKSEFREAKRLDRFTQLGLCAAMEAVERSGLNFAS